jgi:hypothetical protein
MKRLRHVLGLVGIAFLGFCHTAQAGAVAYGFGVDFTSGPLSGQSARGFIGLNCGSSCNGTFTPSDPLTKLTAFNITVGGLSFSMADDLGFSTGLFPYVTLVDDKVSVFDYSGLLNRAAGDRQLNLSYAFGAGGALFFDPSFVTTEPSFGVIGPVQIPEPTTLPLLSAAIVALVLGRKRGGKSKSGAKGGG